VSAMPITMHQRRERHNRISGRLARRPWTSADISGTSWANTLRNPCTASLSRFHDRDTSTPQMANEQLKNALRRAGLTPEKFAEVVRVSPKTVGRWLAGTTTRTPGTAPRSPARSTSPNTSCGPTRHRLRAPLAISRRPPRALGCDVRDDHDWDDEDEEDEDAEEDDTGTGEPTTNDPTPPSAPPPHPRPPKPTSPNDAGHADPADRASTRSESACAPLRSSPAGHALARSRARCAPPLPGLTLW